MRIDVATVFPDYLAPVHQSVVGRAIGAGIIDFATHDPRDATTDRHRTVDDAPFGGGPGMVMMAEPWAATLDPLVQDDPLVVVPTPSGRPFTQRIAERYAAESHLVIACGRYEGIDARVWEHYRADGIRIEEVSIGDYVLAGGEPAALVIIEAVARLLPGALGNDESAADDSFGADRPYALEGPVYTRPREWRGLAVPEILLSGDHARIEQWRRDQSEVRTRTHRPDLAP